MLNVICVKTGDKYSAEYVNKLQSMVKRNLVMEHRFICITDDQSGLNPDMYILEALYEGWWSKLQVFEKIDFIFEDGEPVLFIDLDMLIVNDLGALVNYGLECLEKAPLVILEDFNRPNGYGSAIFMIRANTLSRVYKKFAEYPNAVMKGYKGDQQYLEKVLPCAMFWPREWVLSYKVDKLHTEPLPDTAKVVCFHGPPKNHEVDDEWVKELWK